MNPRIFQSSQHLCQPDGVIHREPRLFPHLRFRADRAFFPVQFASMHFGLSPDNEHQHPENFTLTEFRHFLVSFFTLPGAPRSLIHNPTNQMSRTICVRALKKKNLV